MTDTRRVSSSVERASRVRLLILGLAIAVLLLASAVRFHRLGKQSLWYDEGVAYAHSLRTLPELIPALQPNVHVPAYFILLGVWEDLAGASEFSLRALSALFSVIGIAWTYALGKRLFHPAAGLAAAALVAFNSFSIYYAQEARMYGMLTAIAGASMWLYIAFLRDLSANASGPARLPYIILLGAVNAIGIYTHVAFALVLLAQGALALFWLGATWKAEAGIVVRRLLIDYCLANLLSLLAFLPWLPDTLLQVFSRPNLSAAAPPDLVLRWLQGHFAFGSTFELGMGNMIFAIYFFLLLGLMPAKGGAQKTRSWWNTLLPLIWVLLSALIYLALELTTRFTRFLLPAQLAFALWLGRGFWVLWTWRARGALSRQFSRLAALGALAFCLLTMAKGLDKLYHHPDYQRDDFRGLVKQIEDNLREGDAVIVSALGVEEVLRYYYDASAPVYGLPSTADENITRRQVLQIVAEHNRIHAVFYGAVQQDPKRIIETTLNENAFEIREQWFGDVRFALYAAPLQFDEWQRPELPFGEQITLAAYAINSQTVEAEDVLQVQLVWMADETPSKRYKVFLQLLNGEGALVAQRDSEPAGGSAITTTWAPGESIVDNHGLSIPSGLPLGDYRLVAGLYDIDDPSARLIADGESYAVLGEIVLR